MPDAQAINGKTESYKIGCSQENLSRAFATLCGLGVETKSGVVVLRDVSRLRVFAGLQ